MNRISLYDYDILVEHCIVLELLVTVVVELCIDFAVTVHLSRVLVVHVDQDLLAGVPIFIDVEMIFRNLNMDIVFIDMNASIGLGLLRLPSRRPVEF